MIFCIFERILWDYFNPKQKALPAETSLQGIFNLNGVGGVPTLCTWLIDFFPDRLTDFFQLTFAKPRPQSKLSSSLGWESPASSPRLPECVASWVIKKV